MTAYRVDSIPKPRAAYLDGKALHHCVMADPKKGKAIVYMLDKNGTTKIDKYGKRPLTKTLYGNVEVKF